MRTVSVQSEPFDLVTEMAPLRQLPGVGAVATFTGICRDEGGRLEALELEHYPGMAEAEIVHIAEEATTRWSLAGITVIHRFGRIDVGEDIVLVVTAARGREAALAAASFVMDFLKTRAPFWKKEHATGAPAGSGEWVAARSADDEAADRWR